MMGDKCTVTDGRFVVPCDSLESATDSNMGGFSKKRCVTSWHLFNRSTGNASRSYFGIKSANHKNGFLFNFCPFCGETIDAPFADNGSEAE